MIKKGGKKKEGLKHLTKSVLFCQSLEIKNNNIARSKKNHPTLCPTPNHLHPVFRF